MAKLSPESFCYWLQGFMEMQNPEELDSKQTQIIKDHLNEVFDKVTPDRKRAGLPHFCKSELPEGFKKMEIKPKEKKLKSIKKKSKIIDADFIFPENKPNAHRGLNSRLIC